MPSEAAINTGQSLRINERSTRTGWINAVTPRMSARLAMLEPMTFPTVMPGLPSRAARADAMISGAEVPMDTMVNPTMTGGMRILMASPEANLTR